VRTSFALLARISLDLSILGRISLAALLGYLIGYEREIRGSPAGDRTFALVALGAAVAILVGAGDLLVGLGGAVLIFLILEMQYVPFLRGLAAETRRQRRAREGRSRREESSRT
jgi:hypothetical protein